MCNLLYPESKEEAIKFEEVVCSSLCPDQTTPAWCEKCRKYQPTLQSRTLRTLPHILSLNAGMDNQQDVEYWQAQMQMLYERNRPQEEEGEGGEDEASSIAGEVTATEAKEEPSSMLQPPTSAKPCRYGLGCNRPDCKFWHPHQQQQQQQQQPQQQQHLHGQDGGAGGDLQDVGDRLAKLGLSWVPHRMDVVLKPHGKVTVAGEDDEEVKDEEGETTSSPAKEVGQSKAVEGVERRKYSL